MGQGVLTYSTLWQFTNRLRADKSCESRRDNNGETHDDRTGDVEVWKRESGSGT
jgi:hypothetical protein